MKNNINGFSNLGFYLSIIGITLASISMYNTLGTGNGIIFIIGLLIITLSIDILLFVNDLKGTKYMKNGITFSFICIVGIGMVCMIISLMDVMSTTNLILFSIGMGLILNSFIRRLAKKPPSHI